jgi:hypothetical protein
LGVELVIGALVILEGDVLHRVEAIGRLAAGDDGIALIELEAHHAGHALLALIGHGLQHAALGAEPEAVIDDLGIARHQAVLEMRRLTVEGDALNGAVRLVEDGAARGFVAAAALHADEAVFHQI